MNYKDFQRAVSFLKTQGIEPTLDMLSLESEEWNRLMNLVGEWEAEVKTHTQPEITEAEMEADKVADDEANLFYSC